MTGTGWEHGTGNPWDDLFARFFGGGDVRRPVHRVDITRLMSAECRALLADAARRAARAGQPRPGHRPPALGGAAARAAAGPGPPRRRRIPRRCWPSWAGAVAARTPTRAPEQISLTPATKRALLEAHQISRAAGAVVHRPRAPAARAGRQPGLQGRPAAGRRPVDAPLGAGGRRARPARSRPARPGPAGAGQRVGRQHADPGRVRPGPHRAGPARAASTRWWVGRTRSSRPSRCSPGAPRTTRC